MLIPNDRYGAAYEGAAYPKHPLRNDPERRVSVTWYEYLRAPHCGKPIRILVCESIWDQRSVFQAVRKSGHIGRKLGRSIFSKDPPADRRRDHQQQQEQQFFQR